MLNQLRSASILFLALTVLTGLVYPLAITAIAQVVFHDLANGSIIAGADSRSVGSALIGQEFGTSDPASAPGLAQWFWSRPSATGPVPYTALNLERGTGSSGSNLAPTSAQLLDNISARILALNAADTAVGLRRGPESARVPVDLVTSSGSGLDPHISPAAAEYQVPRVARARSLSEDAVRELVRRHTAPRTFGLIGEPVVHVLKLNLALDAASR